MSTLVISINTDNAAFDDDKAPEITRILNKFIHAMNNDGNAEFPLTLRDINGNTVGTAEIEGE